MNYEKTYSNNRNLINTYQWWKETNPNLPEFSELFRTILQVRPHQYLYVDKAGNRSSAYQIDQTEINTRPFFLDLTKPLLLKSEMNLYNLKYVVDNARRSEDYGADNHVYLYYESVEELGLLLSVCNISSLLEEEKIFFVIGKDALKQNYPYDFIRKCGIDYSMIGYQPLRIEEIKRIIIDRPTDAFSGNIFMAGILDAHPNMLTMQGFGNVGFVYLYDLYFEGETVKGCKKNIEKSISNHVIREFSEMFVRKNSGGYLSEVPDWSMFWDLLYGYFEDDVPSRSDLFKGFFLAYNEALGKSTNNRISPAIRVTTHQIGPMGIKYYELQPIFDSFSYRRTICINRAPSMRLASKNSHLVLEGIVKSKLRKEAELLGINLFQVGSYSMPANRYLSSRWETEKDLKENVKIIRFEDLKLRPLDALRAVCVFLDVPFSKTLWHTTENGARAGWYSEGSKKNVSDYDPTPATKFKMDVMDRYDYYRMEWLHRTEMAAFNYDYKFYDGKTYTDEEIIDMFRKPFKMEKFYYLYSNIGRREHDRDAMIINVQNSLLHPADQTVDGEQLYPVPMIDPHKGAALFEKYGGTVEEDILFDENSAKQHSLEWKDMKRVGRTDLESLFCGIDKEIKDFEIKLKAIENGIKVYDTLFFYGAGTDGRLLANELKSIWEGKKVCFLDKDKNKHGKEVCFGLLCNPLAEAFGCEENAAIILTTSLYADDIKRELISPAMQTKERLQGIDIIDQYCIIYAKIQEKKLLLDNKDLILFSFDKVDDDKSQFDIYWNTWMDNYSRQIVQTLQVPRFVETRNTMERFGDYYFKIVNDKKTVIGGFLLGNTLKTTQPFWENSEHVDVFEMNRLYCEELRETYKAKRRGSRLKFCNYGVGESSERLDYSQYDGPYGMRSYLYFISDDKVNMVSLDDVYVDNKIGLTGTDDGQSEIGLIILTMENGQTDALKGARKLIERDRPALMIQPFGHFSQKKDYYWNLLKLLDGWNLGYRFILRGIYRGEYFLCAIPQR